MMCKLLLAAVSSLALITAADAASIPTVSGAQDPSQLNATINGVITNIIAGTSGLVAAGVGPATSVATTTALNFVSTSIPTSTLNLVGQTLRVHCWGRTAANTNNKTLNVVLGSNTISTPLVSTASLSWQIWLEAQWQSATTAGVIGRAEALSAVNAANAYTLNNITVTSSRDASTNWAAAVTASCGYLQGSSSQDVTMDGFTVEQVK